MTYLVFFEGKVFYTNWFDVDNLYVQGMTVVNRINHTYTTDGKTWLEIEEDHL